MTAPVLMVLGTSSSAGKSLLVAALCRIFARHGIRVAPFKAQNMSNNAGVCADGSEIGRAQITQAFAAGIEPTAQMNPVLLKPEGNARSQVVVLGKAQATLSARNYYERKQKFWSAVTDSLDALRDEYELVIAEGAGSPVELNLKPGDIVNMAVAMYADAKVILVGDIDRGGIFAQLLGTYWLLEKAEQDKVIGFLVNKFRGDPTLFADGVDILTERSGVPVLGVVPWVTDLNLPEEDGVALDSYNAMSNAGSAIDIAIIRVPRISNFDDFDPFLQEPGVRIRYVTRVRDLGSPDAIILPGTKTTMPDLAWLQDRGFDSAIADYAQNGGTVVGICGGYQMLGTSVTDPDYVESDLERIAGLGLLPVETAFVGEKATFRSEAKVHAENIPWLDDDVDDNVTAYEIHMGQSTSASNWLTIEKRSSQPVQHADGAISPDGKIWGCYLHGLFANHGFRRAWLKSLGWEEPTTQIVELDAALDRLADVVEAEIDIDVVLNDLGLKRENN